jgi:hypothetical protein
MKTMPASTCNVSINEKVIVAKTSTKHLDATSRQQRQSKAEAAHLEQTVWLLLLLFRLFMLQRCPDPAASMLIL